MGTETGTGVHGTGRDMVVTGQNATWARGRWFPLVGMGLVCGVACARGVVGLPVSADHKCNGSSSRRGVRGGAVEWKGSSDRLTVVQLQRHPSVDACAKHGS